MHGCEDVLDSIFGIGCLAKAASGDCTDVRADPNQELPVRYLIAGLGARHEGTPLIPAAIIGPDRRITGYVRHRYALAPPASWDPVFVGDARRTVERTPSQFFLRHFSIRTRETLFGAWSRIYISTAPKPSMVLEFFF
jgi:hypothetical protein